MKILVYAHRLEVGGTQVNAIEIAAALRDLHGYDVLLFATPGPMVKLIEEKGLRFLPAPEPHIHPSPARMRALRDAVRCERPDLLHVWDWQQCLDAYCAVHLPQEIPMVVTDMYMSLTRLLPRALPTTFGVPALVDLAKARGWRQASLLLPPVDARLNAPGAVDPGPFRRRYGIEHGAITLVTVCRLSEWLKSESLIRTISVVRALGRDMPLQFVIVGDGVLRAKLQRLADEINAELKRSAVILTGALLDPRPAYAAADIVVGMGGSALRGMAFGKPAVIVGEKGFSASFTPATAESFYYQGIYGLGDGDPGNSRLAADIRGLAEHPGRLPGLGAFARQFVLRHFSLEVACTRLVGVFQSAVSELPTVRATVTDVFRTAAICLRERNIFPDGHVLRRRFRLWQSRT